MAEELCRINYCFGAGQSSDDKIVQARWLLGRLLTLKGPIIRGRLIFEGGQYPCRKDPVKVSLNPATTTENLLSYANFNSTFHDGGQKDNLIKT